MQNNEFIVLCWFIYTHKVMHDFHSDKQICEIMKENILKAWLIVLVPPKSQMTILANI